MPRMLRVESHIDQTSYWVKAWIDADSDEAFDSDREAWGVWPNSPISLSNSVWGVDFALTDVDADTDDPPDWWEFEHFGSITSRETDGSFDACLITRNLAKDDGGGIRCTNASPSFVACVISANTAHDHGGGFWGGGVHLKGPTAVLALESCTVMDNRARLLGGGMAATDAAAASATNSIFWGNTPDQLSGVSGLAHCCVEGGASGTGIVTNHPSLTPIYYRILADSPCIDAGTNAAWMAEATDLHGQARIGDDTVDIAADEWHGAASGGDAPGDGTPGGVWPLSPPEDSELLRLEFSVGDRSNSGSETYRIVFSNASEVVVRECTTFGIVHTFEHDFLKGTTYTVRVEHIATSGTSACGANPDYDYRAWIAERPDSTNGTHDAWFGGPGFVVHDPDRILGTHGTDGCTSTFAASNKTATLYILKVESIEASSPVATNSPQFFEGGRTNFGDPCSGGLSPGQALIVFFDAVRSIDPATSNEVVNDFDVTLNAHILPPSITADQLTENWSKVHGPTSGSLNRTDTFEVKYQNPKKGGLYQFEFDLGLPGYPKSGANVLLPLAGAESSAFVQTEFARIRTWVDNQLPGIPIVDRLFAVLLLRRAMTVSANLDYAPGNWIGGESPCRRYSIYANETLTVEGVVMSSPKLANMMWGVMCRRFMYWDWFTNLGADIRNRIDHGVLSGDSTAARNSYELGRDLSEDGIGALHNKMREYRDLIREPNAVEFRLFPSEDTLSAPPQVPALP